MKNIAIITGASSGIGKIFAKTVTNHGTYDEIWAIARNTDRLEALRGEISIPVRPVSLDLSDESFVDRIKSMLEEEKPNIRLPQVCLRKINRNKQQDAKKQANCCIFLQKSLTFASIYCIMLVVHIPYVESEAMACFLN